MGYVIVKRLFDILLSTVALVFLLFPMAVIVIMVKVSSPGPSFHWSNRVGQKNQCFRMPKFRTMWIDTPLIATHQLPNPDEWLTPIGSFLRKTSIDELPQLWSILKGDMSFVGPRPALFNQDDLVILRTEAGIHELAPGLTGWAQVNGRDDLSITDKVKFDIEYLRRRSFKFDLEILWLTLLKVPHRSGVSH